MAARKNSDPFASNEGWEREPKEPKEAPVIEEEDDSEGPVTITVKEDEDEDEDETAAAPPVVGIRDEKKRARGSALSREKERAEAAEREREMARQEAAELRARQAQMQADYQRWQAQLQQQQQNRASPAEQELDRIYERQQFLSQQLEQRGADITQEELKAIRDEGIQLRKRELAAGAALNGSQQPQYSQEQIQQIVHNQQLVERYGDITSNQQAYNWGRALLAQKMAEGYQYNWETLDMVAQETRQRFKMAGSVQSRPRTAAHQLTATSRGGGNVRSNGGNGQITLSTHERKMAHAYYAKQINAGKMTERQAEELQGRKLLEKRRRSAE